MFCKTCGKENSDDALFCVGCGASIKSETKYCNACGRPVDEGVLFCPVCGAPVKGNGDPNAKVINDSAAPEQKSRLAAGLLGIFLGSIGIHNFYLGFTSRAVIQIIVTLVTCGLGGIWGFIEGIMILVGSVKIDANGVPLKD